MVKHIDVAARPRGHGRRALDFRPARANARKIVAHAAATAHGLSRFAQRLINAGVAVCINALYAVAHGLHKAVDKRGLDGGASGAHDAPGANGTVAQIVQKQGLKLGLLGWLFDRGQGLGNTAQHVVGAGFAGFEVFFAQHVVANGLRWQRGGQEAGDFGVHAATPCTWARSGAGM